MLQGLWREQLLAADSELSARPEMTSSPARCLLCRVDASRVTMALSTLLAMISWLVRLLLRPSRPAAGKRGSVTDDGEEDRGQTKVLKACGR